MNIWTGEEPTSWPRPYPDKIEGINAQDDDRPDLIHPFTD
jgi:hypothetical protein